jgi:hypothetical protein
VDQTNSAQFLCQSVAVSKHKLMDEIDSLLDEAMSRYMKRRTNLQELQTIVKYLESLVQLLKKMQSLDSLESFDARLMFRKVNFSEHISISVTEQSPQVFSSTAF